MSLTVTTENFTRLLKVTSLPLIFMWSFHVWRMFQEHERELVERKLGSGGFRERERARDINHLLFLGFSPKWCMLGKRRFFCNYYAAGAVSGNNEGCV